MTQLLFSTGNAQKFAKGQAVCTKYDIILSQEDLKIDEVQSEDSEYVARKKAEAAFNTARVPVIVSDDSWAFLGLNGFPGTYAKSVNHWFSPQDYVRLLQGIDDRRVIFTQALVYQDADHQELFIHETTGTALTAPQGEHGATTQKIVSLEPDGKTSISQMLGTGTHYSSAATLQVWHDFAKWFSTKELQR